VLGCTGSVGSALSRLLIDDDLDLTLIGRSENRVGRVLPDLAGRAHVSGDLADVRRADVVVVVTNDPSALLKPEIFSGATSRIVVIDVAQPPNIDRAEYPGFAREGVVVVEGGLAHIPGFVSTHDLDTPPGGTYACLAETYLVAREGIREHWVGATTPERVALVRRIAERRGISTRPLGLEEAAPVGAAR
jgi:predicted amino acid dehydrogenase